MDQYGFKLISYLTAKCQISWAVGVFKLIIDGQWITIGDIRAAVANLQFVSLLRHSRNAQRMAAVLGSDSVDAPAQRHRNVPEW